MQVTIDIVAILQGVSIVVIGAGVLGLFRLRSGMQEKLDTLRGDVQTQITALQQQMQDGFRTLNGRTIRLEEWRTLHEESVKGILANYKADQQAIHHALDALRRRLEPSGRP